MQELPTIPNPHVSAESLADRRRDAALVPRPGAVERLWEVRPSAAEIPPNNGAQGVVHLAKICRDETSANQCARCGHDLDGL
jgi:hypothetical protein